jgi:hypothetical protein
MRDELLAIGQLSPPRPGLVFWLAAGTVLVRWYDRKGLGRIDPQPLQ